MMTELHPFKFKKSDINEHDPLVLIVDDQPNIREMLGWALSLRGYPIASASSGQEAFVWLENALQMGLYPKVILLDVLMPEIQEKVFIEELRARWKSTYPFPSLILLTTTKRNDKHIYHCILEKPFHIEDLYSYIGEVL